MVCSRCQKNKATIRNLDVKSGKQEHLCQACAKAEGLLPGKPAVTMSELVVLANLAGKALQAGTAQVQCPQCGMTLKDFETQKRFGCAKDYEVFADQIQGLLERIHGSSEYRGKVPPGTATGKAGKPQGIVTGEVPVQPGPPIQPIPPTKPIQPIGRLPGKPLPKLPKLSDKPPAKSKLDVLREKLNLLVTGEKYEEAARVRDEIKKAEADGGPQ